MRLEEITLYNFGSFVDKNVIEFGPDLTLFIGDNGDGKTTFFDALKWVLDTAERVPPYCSSFGENRSRTYRWR